MHPPKSATRVISPLSSHYCRHWVVACLSLRLRLSIPSLLLQTFLFLFLFLLLSHPPSPCFPFPAPSSLAPSIDLSPSPSISLAFPTGFHKWILVSHLFVPIGEAKAWFLRGSEGREGRRGEAREPPKEGIRRLTLQQNSSTSQSLNQTSWGKFLPGSFDARLLPRL